MMSNVDQPSLAVPAYDSAMGSFLSAALDLIISTDPMLGQIATRTTGHAGPARNVAGRHPIDHDRSSVQTNLSIHGDIIRLTDIESFIGVLFDTAASYRDQLGTLFLQTLREVTEAEGTSIDAEGRPLTWDLFLDALEPTEFTFDADERPQPLQVLINPETASRLLAIEVTPDQRQRFETMVQTKREAWNAQKRTRRLPQRRQGAGI